MVRQEQVCLGALSEFLTFFRFYLYVGKSTVAALLERYYDLDEGLVLLDGRDIQHLDPRWLRGHIVGFINQASMSLAVSYFSVC